jgi:DNA-binding MarR family transcriptional regulator
MTKKAGAPRPLPSRLSTPAVSPGFLLWKVSNAWQRKQRAALEPFQLTHSQFVLLATATWFGAHETLTQARLAELSGVDPMTTSQVVRTLEAAQLLERLRHPDDPRAKAIVVTQAGRAKAALAVVAVEEVDAAFFAPLSDRTAELVEMFGRLVAADGVQSGEPLGSAGSAGTAARKIASRGSRPGRS